MAPINQLPTAYGYIRVSTEIQVGSGLSLESQRQRVNNYFDLQLKESFNKGCIFTEEGISAFKHPLPKRPEGSLLESTIMAGDQVIIPKLDRAFRSIIDFADTLSRWHKRDIGVHLLDLGVDTTTSGGKLVASIMASIAEWESRRIGERIREAMLIRRQQGRATNGTPPIGFRKLLDKMVVPDQEEIDIGMKITAMRDAGLSMNDVAEKMNTAGTFNRSGKRWTKHSVRRWDRAARMGFPRVGI